MYIHIFTSNLRYLNAKLLCQNSPAPNSHVVFHLFAAALQPAFQTSSAAWRRARVVNPQRGRNQERQNGELLYDASILRAMASNLLIPRTRTRGIPG